ncbi:hypothetical protein TL16_g07333, partial [Triparma laevis f. inornata]
MTKLLLLITLGICSILSNALSTTTPKPARVGRLSRIRASLKSEPRSRSDLKNGIAGFYDRSSKLWEDVWGEHMHHGYYEPEDREDHTQAQVDMIDKLLDFSSLDGSKISSVVDVGCGIGGSSRHIAKKYNCEAKGVTLSPYQAKRGNELAEEQGLKGKSSFQVADALSMPFPDSSFDLVWSLESGEHMPDKEKFVGELTRVAKKGSSIILCTWVHRDLEEGEELTKKEVKLLRKINRAYYLPDWCSSSDYQRIFSQNDDVDISTMKVDDWSYVIAPFWKAVIKSSLNLRSVVGLLRSGFSTIRGAYAMGLMLRAVASLTHAFTQDSTWD